MSYTRVQAATYLARTFSKLVSYSWQTSVLDDADGWQFVIDEALRKLEVGEDALATYEVTSADTRDYLALLRYYALVSFAFSAATATSWSVDGDSANEKAIFDNIQALLANAKTEVEALGYVVDVTSQFRLGTLTLDFLEPSEAN